MCPEEGELAKREQVYNPLDRKNLGTSVANALLSRPPEALPPEHPFKGAGIYAIYYVGDFPAYHSVSEENRSGKFAQPIYIGKAVPSGARKGAFDLDPGQTLYRRLEDHAESIKQAKNLRIADFYCRFLVVDDIWIPLGESLLISRFRPLWNTKLDGFGNHDPGKGRYQQMMSPWDVVHPGRIWAERCKPYLKTEKELLRVLTEGPKNKLDDLHN